MENQKETINGIDPLLTLFGNDKQKLIDHIIENTLFFEPETVIEQSSKVIENISLNIPIPVRHSQTRGIFRTAYKSIKLNDRKAARTRAKTQSIFHTETDLQIYFDGDGNSALRRQINEITSLEISLGEKGSITNYIISHIWENTSHNPYFFSLLWNVVITPRYLDFIIDRSIMIGNICVRDIIKAISIQLYNPEKIMERKLFNGEDSKDQNINNIAKKYIQQNRIKFLSSQTDKAHNNNNTTKPLIINKTMKDLNPSNIQIKSDNKKFAFQSLSRLIESKTNFIDSLLDLDFCKKNFNMSYPILKLSIKNSDFDECKDHKGRNRYYTPDFFSINGNTYFVCNHWYKIQRELFTMWINMQLTK